MKKNLFYLVTVFMVAIVSAGFVSCGDDNEEGGPLVGSWTCDNHFYGGSDTYIFKADGTYEWSCRGWNDDTMKSGKYYYNKDLSTLTITNKKGTTWVYIMVSLTDSFFVIMDEDGSTYTYSKR